MTRLGIMMTGVLGIASSAFAVPIMFIHEGNGTGSLDGVGFAGADFVITAFGDTDDQSPFFPGVFLFPHSSASITIAGVGVFDFTIDTMSFHNTINNTVGFSHLTPVSDLFNGPYLDELAGWDRESSIGPLTGEGELLQWSSFPVTTTGGVLFFETDFDTQATFTAIVPAPAGAILIAMLGLSAARRRR